MKHKPEKSAFELREHRLNILIIDSSKYAKMSMATLAKHRCILTLADSIESALSALKEIAKKSASREWFDAIVVNSLVCERPGETSVMMGPLFAIQSASNGVRTILVNNPQPGCFLSWGLLRQWKSQKRNVSGTMIAIVDEADCLQAGDILDYQKVLKKSGFFPGMFKHT